MKRLFIVFLLMFSVVALSGCDGSQPQETEPVIGKFHHVDAKYVGEYIASVDYQPTYRAKDQIYWVLDSGCYYIPQGVGTLYLKDKIKYEGEWNYGLPNGQGTVYNDNGNKSYEGEWSRGTRNGHGIQYTDDGEVDFEGEWIGNLSQR